MEVDVMESLKASKGEIRTLQELLTVLKDENNFEEARRLIRIESEKLEVFLNSIGEEECAFFIRAINRLSGSPEVYMFTKFARSDDILTRLSLLDRLQNPTHFYRSWTSDHVLMEHPVMIKYALVLYLVRNIKRSVLEEFVEETEREYGHHPPDDRIYKIGGGFLKKSIYIRGENFSLVRRILTSRIYQNASIYPIRDLKELHD
jgi:ferritin-like protein